MAHYDLEEQEQIDNIKAWWKRYGNLLTGLLTVAALAALAWQGWSWYERKQAAEAAAIYGALEEAVDRQDLQKIKSAAGELSEKYASTAYAPLAALVAGKVSFDNGDLKTARLQFAWAAEKGRNEIRDIARLRLVAVLLDDKAYDEALKQLETAPLPAFAARYAETRGDVLFAQGKKSEARAAYQAALTQLDGKAAKSSPVHRELLQQKLDSLGGAA